MSRIRSIGKLLFFVGIPLLPLLVFWFVPMIVSFWLSFTNWDYISPSFDYVGIENYTNAFTSSDFYSALKNTIFFGFWTILPTIGIGLLLALFVREGLKGTTWFKAFLFSPWITPMVAMSIVWSWIYEPNVGLLNQLLGWFHLPQPSWLTDSDMAMWAIIIVTIWKNAGWAMIFYIDALSKIPHELYEVSDVEGASAWQKFKTIVLPLVSPTTLFLVIITAIDAIQAYDQIQVMTQGEIMNNVVTFVVVTFLNVDHFNFRQIIHPLLLLFFFVFLFFSCKSIIKCDCKFCSVFL